MPIDLRRNYVNCYHDVNTQCDFEPPALEDLYGYMTDIDVSSSSCIKGVNSKVCKIMLDTIPEKFRHLFANSLFHGKFPNAWTCAIVTLIPKDGDKNRAVNWRPISQTIFFAKILEKIVHKQLLKYFTTNNILAKMQYGFLPGKSTQEAVFTTVKHIYSTINQNKVMGLIFLDVAKAFNCLDHNVLYDKLKNVGMSERILKWFRSYLTRTQVVKYGDEVSDKLTVTAGIAQGTVLGPLVFIFYMNDCVKVLDRSIISMYADDCVLYYTGNNWNTVYDVLQSDLSKLVDWTSRNMLKLNSEKTQAMIVGTRNKISKIKDPKPFLITGKGIKYVKKYNYLGIVLDPEMTLAPLCKVIEKRVIDKIYMLRKLGKYLTYKASIQIYKQVILPILDYAGFLLVACNKNKKNGLQIMQNDALRFCNNTRRNDKVTLVELHNKAKLASLEQRRCVQLLSLMFKISKIEENRAVAVRMTRQQVKYVFRLDNRVGTKYSHSPYYVGSMLWDKLPRDIQFAESNFQFKDHVKKYTKSLWMIFMSRNAAFVLFPM